MPRRNARSAQVESQRLKRRPGAATIFRAAKQAGADRVTFLPDGTYQIYLQPANGVEPQEIVIADDDEVVL